MRPFGHGARERGHSPSTWVHSNYWNNAPLLVATKNHERKSKMFPRVVGWGISILWRSWHPTCNCASSGRYLGEESSPKRERGSTAYRKSPGLKLQNTRTDL